MCGLKKDYLLTEHDFDAQKPSRLYHNEWIKPLPREELLSITQCWRLNVWSQERFSANWTDFDAQKPSWLYHNERDQTFANRRAANLSKKVEPLPNKETAFNQKSNQMKWPHSIGDDFNAKKPSTNNLSEKVKPLSKEELLSITKSCFLNVWSHQRLVAKWTERWIYQVVQAAVTKVRLSCVKLCFKLITMPKVTRV